jgi:hypothetical protein
VAASEKVQDAINPRQGWLAAAIPASARRFRVSDRELAATLVAARAELVDSDPDVEILSPRALLANAPWVVVNVDHAPSASERRDARALPIRVSRRFSAAMLARAEACGTSRRLSRQGYRRIVRVPWDLDQPILAPEGFEHEKLCLAERLPRSVLVVGQRGAREPTLLDTILRETAIASDPSSALRALVRESGLVIVGSSTVLRVTLGRGAHSIDAQKRALAQLHALAPDDVVAKRLPRVLARRRTSLADWSLEQKVVGNPPPYPLSSTTLRDCLEFLVALHLVRGRAGVAGPSSEASTVADACDPPEAAALRSLGQRLESRLGEIPRGFAHGDFWSGNLFVDDGGRLSGVVDWEHAASGRLPLLDLVHLELNAVRPPSPERWGPALINRLFPWARAGGGELARSYSEQIGLTLSPTLLVDLVVAYWLNRLAFEIGTYSDRRLRRPWMKNNVELVLREAIASVE